MDLPIAAGVKSAGGLAVFAVKKFLLSATEIQRTDEEYNMIIKG